MALAQLADGVPLLDAGSSSGGLDDGIDLATVWRVLFEHRILVLACCGVGLALALGYSLLQTPLYRSTATLELNPPTIPVLTGSDKGDQNLVVPTTGNDFLATQYGLLRSKSLAAHVVEDLNLLARRAASQQGVPKQKQLNGLADELAGNLEVKPVPNSRLVELSYVSAKPGDAAAIVNGFAKAFIASTLERRYAAAASARDFLKKRLEAVRNDLNESEKKLVAYAKANGIVTTGLPDSGSSPTGTQNQSTLQGASLAALNAALTDAQQRRIAAEEKYRHIAGAGATSEVSERTAALRQEKAEAQADYQAKSTYLKPDYPEMVRLRTKIDSLNKAIAAEAGNVSGSRANTLRSEYQAALAEENALRSKVNQMKGAVFDQEERSIQYNILRRQVDTNRSLYDALLQRYNEIGVAGGVDTPQASLVDSGEVPEHPYSPNIPLNLLIGLLVGTAAGAGVAFLLFFITDKITTPEDVRDKLRLAPLGIIPRKKRNEDLAESLVDQKSPISEAYASLATALRFTTPEGAPKVLLVTSSLPNEGKSTTAFVLASLMAQNGHRTLLIDADMRHPSFLVNATAEIGLSQLAVGDGEVNRSIIRTSQTNLWLMPSGPIPPNPVQILESPRTARIVERARELFDVVIIDAPPSFGFADAMLLSSSSDAILLVVESGKTRRRVAARTLERLRSVNANVIGAVLSKYRTSTSEYGYRYYTGEEEGKSTLQPHELAATLLKQSMD